MMPGIIQTNKEELQKRGYKGFTLMEMLIVIAIIAILVAIAIPIFTAQLEKAREATDAANIRAAYAEVSADALVDGNTTANETVNATQTSKNWAINNGGATTSIGNIEVSATNLNGWTVAYDSDSQKVTITEK
jgi:type IV pilus assembly protein PilA